jgi:hypothetical protein
MDIADMNKGSCLFFWDSESDVLDIDIECIYVSTYQIFDFDY